MPRIRWVISLTVVACPFKLEFSRYRHMRDSLVQQRIMGRLPCPDLSVTFNQLVDDPMRRFNLVREWRRSVDLLVPVICARQKHDLSDVYTTSTVS